MICVKRKVVNSNSRKKGGIQVVSASSRRSNSRQQAIEDRSSGPCRESEQKKEKKMLNESKKIGERTIAILARVVNFLPHPNPPLGKERE
jgi:hypothetical protein